MKVLVTGGGGFLGFEIVKKLLARGDKITVIGRHKYKHVEELGAKSIVADICEASSLQAHFHGVDEVYHVAALAGLWGSWKNYYNINVVGTQNVINACLSQGVSRLIYTSSPSVVFDGKSHRNVDESIAYPKKHLSHYSKSKMLAEKLVLESNSATLRTVALRPHLIWGPGDPHIFPRIVGKAKKGQLAIVGNADNDVDIIFVENAAEAHLQAGNVLRESGSTAGKAYFLGQNEPVKLWRFIQEILKREGVPPVTKRIPFWAAYTLGTVLEFVHRILGITSDPRMTRFLACQLSQDHFYNHKRAIQDFHYDATVSVEEGLNRIYSKGPCS